MRPLRNLSLAIGLVAASCPLASQSGSAYVPMADGTRLAVDWYLPDSHEDGARYPALLELTRYWRGRENPDTGEPMNSLRPVERYFLEHGYAGTTIAGIARGAGVASNVVHWYFASKDDLFARAVDDLQVETLEAIEASFATSPVADDPKRLAQVLIDLTVRVGTAHHLIATVHERAPRSTPIAELHDRAHARYEALLRRLLERIGVHDASADLVATALFSSIEGLVMHRATPSECARMLNFLVPRLASDA